MSRKQSKPRLLPCEYGDRVFSFRNPLVPAAFRLHTKLPKRFLAAEVGEFADTFEKHWNAMQPDVSKAWQDMAELMQYGNAKDLAFNLVLCHNTRYTTQSSRNWLTCHRESIRVVVSHILGAAKKTEWLFWSLNLPSNMALYCEPMDVNVTVNFGASKFKSVIHDVMSTLDKLTGKCFLKDMGDNKTRIYEEGSLQQITGLFKKLYQALSSKVSPITYRAIEILDFEMLKTSFSNMIELCKNKGESATKMVVSWMQGRKNRITEDCETMQHIVAAYEAVAHGPLFQLE